MANPTETATTSPSKQLRWNEDWPRVSAEEYGLTAALWGMVIANRRLLPTNVGWKESLLFDDAVRDWLRLDDEDARFRASDWSDAFMIGLMLYPHLIDTGVIALAKERNLDLAEQLTVMNLEALGVSTAIVTLLKPTIGRVRPNADACDAAGTDFTCRGTPSRSSFPSGHSATAFTSAGLVCVHHQHLRLYGSKLAGALACGSAIGLATLTGGLRIAADRHYATDVLAGAAIGFVTGYGLPRALHYDAPLRRSGRTGSRGYAEISALFGMLSGAGDAGVAGGGRIQARQQFQLLDELAVELGARGQAIKATQGAAQQVIAGDLRLWMFGVAPGLHTSYTNHQVPSDGFNGASVGPSLAFGYMGRGSMVLLSGSWGPVFDEELDKIEGRIDLAWLEYLTVGVEAQYFAPRRGSEHRGSSVFLSSVGGRLPW